MIYHCSIPARDTRHVAKVLGEIMGGPVMHFVPGGPRSYVVWSGYGHGSSVEVVPEETRHTPGPVDRDMVYQAGPPVDPAADPYSAVHLAIASPLSEAQVLAVAAREGWKAVTCWRGKAFPLVEVWVENRLMIEFFPAEMQSIVTAFSTPEKWQAEFGLREADGVYEFPPFSAQGAAPAAP